MVSTKVEKVMSLLAKAVRYGRPEDGGSWWVHWQNISKADRQGDAPLRGQAWLNFAPDGSTALRISWSLVSKFAHLGVRCDRDEAELGIDIALPPVAFWVSFESWPLLHKLTEHLGDREVRVSVHDDCVWWNLGTDPNRWSERTPRWRKGSIDLASLVLGEQFVVKTPLGEPVPVQIPMPEGLYDGMCMMTLVRVGRPRWLSSYFQKAEIEMKTPIPVPGKGETGYDIEDDALHSQSMPARSVADAVGHVVKSVLTLRERRAGRGWTPARASAAPAAEA